MGPFRGRKRRVVQVHQAEEFLAKHRLFACALDATEPARARLARGDLPSPPPVLRTAFPSDPFGNSVRAAVEIAAADRSVPFIHLALNGLDNDKHHSVDTHEHQLKWHGDALSRLAHGLAALREGLVEIGRWDEALVLTYDEFGRCPAENDRKGTHHGAATTHFAMGGRVKGGLYGEAPEVTDIRMIGGPDPVIDTRRLWTSVVARWWGADTRGLFSGRHAPLDLLRA
jgi:uncharacterized protein (DUF1501 family)